MIKKRPLTRSEISQLIEEAPIHETENLKQFLEAYNMDAFDFFHQYGVDCFSLLNEDRPLYLAVLIKGKSGRLQFWTIVNENIKEMTSLCKMAKRELKEWLGRYKEIYATMDKKLTKNIKWTKWLGFKELEERDNLITFVVTGG